MAGDVEESKKVPNVNAYGSIVEARCTQQTKAKRTIPRSSMKEPGRTPAGNAALAARLKS